MTSIVPSRTARYHMLLSVLIEPGTTPALKITSWLAVHYAGIGKYVIGSTVALVISGLGAASIKLNLLYRWMYKAALALSLCLIAIAAAINLAKVTRSVELARLPYIALGSTYVCGLVLLLSAAALRLLYRRTLRRRLEATAAASFQQITKLAKEIDLANYVKLNASTGRTLDDVLRPVTRNFRATITTLTGPAGSGKSATLVDVALQCKKAWDRKRTNLAIPIFVDLAKYMNDANALTLREFIIRGSLHDAELIRQLEELWREKQQLVTWIFLMDNAEDIIEPSAQDSNSRDVLEDIAQFIASNRRSFRAVIAGRQVPNFVGARTLDLGPVDRTARKVLLSELGVSDVQQASLSADKSVRQYVGNPGWIKLVGPVLAKTPNIVSENFYDVMSHVVAELIGGPARIADDRRAAALKVGGQLAMQFYTYPFKERISASEAAQIVGDDLHIAANDVAKTLRTLVDSQIIEEYLGSESSTIRFRHGALQDYLAVSRLLHEPTNVDLDQMFRNPALSLVAISLLQVGDDATVGRLVGVAQELIKGFESVPPTGASTVNRLLRSANVAERQEDASAEDRPPWSALAFRILHALDAGLQRKPEAFPEGFRQSTDFLLANALGHATLHEQAEMVDVQYLAHADVASAVCALSLRSKSGKLVDSAVAQIASRIELLDLMRIRDRLSFVISIGVGGIDQYAARYVNPETASRLRLASVSGLVAPPLLALAVALEVGSWSFAIVSVFVGAICTASVVMARKDNSLRWAIIARGCRYTVGALIAVSSIAALIFVGAAVYFLRGDIFAAGTLITALAALWPLTSFVYLSCEAKPTTRSWAFPFYAEAERIWRDLQTRKWSVVPRNSKRLAVGTALWVVIILLFAGLGKVMDRKWHFNNVSPSMDHRLHILLTWVGWLGVGVCVIAFPVADTYVDFRWIRRHQDLFAHSDAEQILAWLMKLHTLRGTVRLMKVIEERANLSASPDIAMLLNDLSRLLQWMPESQNGVRAVSEDEWSSVPSLGTVGLANWLRAYDRAHRGRLRGLAKKHSDHLANYLLEPGRFIDSAIA